MPYSKTPHGERGWNWPLIAALVLCAVVWAAVALVLTAVL